MSKRRPAYARRKNRRKLGFLSVRVARSPRFETLEDRRLLFAGQLDPAFGAGGMVTTDLTYVEDTNERGVAVAHADGKTIVVGQQESPVNGFDRDFVVARYNADGSLDASFGSGGIVHVDFGFGEAANAVAVQADGKIVVAGHSNGNTFAVARLNADGGLDSTFDGDGKQTIAFGVPSETVTPGAEAGTVMLHADGRITLAGLTNEIIAPIDEWSMETQTFAIAAARLNSDGSLDTSFDGDGRLTIDHGAAGETTNSTWVTGALQADGKLILASGENGDFEAYRLNEDGSFDASFDGDGKQTVDFGTAYANVTGIAVQTDGRVVLAGDAGAGGAMNMAVARLNGDGSLDATFNGGGTQTLDLGGNDNARGVALQADGRIVVAGRSDGGLAVVRLATDGALDATFDGDGQVVWAEGGIYNTGNCVDVQADGKIVVATAFSASDTGNDLALARFGADGSLDTAFDGDGIAITALTAVFSAIDQPGIGNFSNPTSFAIQADGRIVVAFSSSRTVLGGPGKASGRYLCAVARYHVDGSLDSTFGSGGVVTFDFGTEDVHAGHVAIQADGKIIVSGTAGDDLAVARLNADGSLDSTFAGDGRQTVAVGPNSAAGGLVLQADGKVVLLGHSNGYFQVVRLNGEGTLDATFDADGIRTIDFGSQGAQARGMAVQADGRIVVVGEWKDDFAVARLNDDGSLDAAFDGDGLLTIDFGLANRGASGVAIQPDGKIVVSGTARANNAPVTEIPAVARLLGDGMLDATFGAGGMQSFQNPDVKGKGNGVALQADGKIILMNDEAYLSSPTAEAIVVLRLNDDASLDASFGDNGRQTISVDAVLPGSVVVQPDGRIVLTAASGGDVLLMRLLGDAENVAPSNIVVSNSALAGDGSFATLTADVVFDDPDANTWTATIDYGDSTVDELPLGASREFSLDHTYTQSGTYIVTITVTDSQGASVVKVGSTAIVIGTTAPDQIEVSVGSVIIDLNGQIAHLFDIDDVLVWGGDGDDVITAQPDVVVPLQLLGGAGSDQLTGGGGENVIDGGAGDDAITGGAGVNVLIGGAGDDTIADGGGANTVIGGGGSNTFVPGGGTTVIETAPGSTTPEVFGDSYATSEDAPLVVDAASGVLANDIDPGSLQLSATLVTGPAHGSLTLNEDGSFSYAPAANFHGADSFTYLVSNDAEQSAPATVQLHVAAVNDAPTVSNAAATVTEDGQALITLSASDVETPTAALVFTITSLPSQGRLATTGGQIVELGDSFIGAPALAYEPGAAREGAGSDGLTFTATDQDGAFSLTSAPGHATIAITKAVPDGQVTIDADGIVRIGGTAANDNILITRTVFGNKLRVYRNGDLVSANIPLNTVYEIHAWGRGGNDTIAMLLVDAPAYLHGGEGNDNLVGGGGRDLLLGGDGSDTLFGAGGDDLLVGGAGSDLILSSGGDDILVGGHVSDRWTDDFLRDVVDQWRHNGQNAEFVAGADDDGSEDALFDSLGDDWFLVGDDLALDLNPFDHDVLIIL